MAIFTSLREQVQPLEPETQKIDLFYQKVTIILFRLTVFLLAPLLFIGSFFYYLDGSFFYAIIELGSGFALIGLVYFYKPKLAIKRSFILLYLYVISIFVLLTTGVSGGGFTSVMMSIIFVFLLTKQYKRYWYFLIVNFIVFMIITVLLYLGVLDQFWIVTYKQTWPFLVVLVNIYSLAAMLTIAYYKQSLEEGYRVSDQQLRYINNLINSVDDIIIAVDGANTITFANKNAYNLVRENTRLIGTNYQQDWGNLFSEYKMPLVLNSLSQELITTGEYVQFNQKERNLLFHRRVTTFAAKDKDEHTYIYVYQDVTARIERERQLEYLSYHDQLTDLYNRRLFEIELKRLDKSRHLPLTMIMLDVNGLKLINDSFGHETGNLFLVKTADAITRSCRASDIIARIGGDEFGILLPNSSRENAQQIVLRIRNILESEQIQNMNISLSVGIGTKLDDTDDILKVYKKMEDDLYQSKLYEGTSIRSKIIDVILKTLYEKNHREMEHSKRVAEYAKQLAVALNYDTDHINRVRLAGLMHDIGKIGIPESILNKTERLTSQEWTEIKQHPDIGYRILKSHNDFLDIATYVREHHERYDGLGYPQQLLKDACSEEGQILAIADAFDAMTGPRTYRSSLSQEEAILELQVNAGSQFNPKLVSLFVSLQQQNK